MQDEQTLIQAFGNTDPRKPVSGPDGDKRRLIEEAEEKAEIKKRLLAARPSWESAQITTSQTSAIDRSNIRKWETVSHETIQEEAPAQVTQEAVSGSIAAAVADLQFGFRLEFVQVNDDGSIRVHIHYGEINLEPPEGMDTGDDFFFDVVVQGTEIWAQITYDGSTLVIDGRTLEFGPSLPDPLHTYSNVDGGVVIVPLGFVDWAFDTDGNPTDIQTHNRWCGDINLQLVLGSHNGKGAILADYAGQWANIDV
jgi:hypothetical protein